jgi:hypothetical protein
MIYCLYLSYEDNTSKLKDDLTKLGKFLNGLDEYKIIFIDNYNEYGEGSRIDATESVLELAGDNSFLDFSGWSSGINYLTEQGLSDKDFFLFVNDTFNKNHFFSFFTAYIYKRRFTRFKDSKGPFILGSRHEAAEDFEVNGKKLNSWIASYFFFVNYKALRVIDFSISSILYDSVRINDAITFSGNLVNPALSKHISNWLMPKKREQGWYKAGKVNAEFLRKKAVSILNEKLLSGSVLQQNGFLFDVYSGFEGRVVKKIDIHLYRLRKNFRLF